MKSKKAIQDVNHGIVTPTPTNVIFRGKKWSKSTKVLVLSV